MSTDYYGLCEPVTYLKLETGQGHDKLKVWINHALAGELTLANRETKQFIKLFAQYSDCLMHTHWGGNECGAVVSEHDEDLIDEMCVISEYGELLTVRQVRARDGAKRSDGLPTELMGYEES
jgi:hypothetical protein